VWRVHEHDGVGDPPTSTDPCLSALASCPTDTARHTRASKGIHHQIKTRRRSRFDPDLRLVFTHDPHPHSTSIAPLQDRNSGTDGHRFSFGTTIWYPIPASQVDRHDVKNRRESIATLRRQGNTWQAVALSVGLSPSSARAVHAACAPTSPSPDDTALLHNLRAFVLQHPSGSRRAYGAWSSRLASPATVVTRFGSWTEAIARALQDDVRAVVSGDGRDQSNGPEHRV